MSFKEKMDRIKRAISGQEDDEEQGIVTEVIDASSLSWSTRIKGFLICFVIGVLFSIMGSFFILISLTLFGVFYTLGNIICIVGTCFLMGPCNQLKKMFSETRFIATLVFLLFMALTLCSAFWWQNVVLTILFCFLQFLAFTWYSISYIPFARDAVKKCFTSCIG